MRDARYDENSLHSAAAGPVGWWVTISWGVSSRAKTSGGRGVQRQQKDVLAARIVSFEPINFHLDKEAPYSVAAWQS
jgi:hypothetical protein